MTQLAQGRRTQVSPLAGVALAAAMFGAVAGGGMTIAIQTFLNSRPAAELPAGGTTVQPYDLTDNTWRLRSTGGSTGADLTDNSWRLRGTGGSSGPDLTDNSWRLR